MLLRLDRLLAGQGFGTRREVKELLGRGAVFVNDAVCARPERKVDPERDCVAVEGRPLRYRAHVYLMMNKPAGVISASEDPRERTVVDLLPPALRRPGLFPAGRLDRDTTGLLLLTDDGAFAHAVLSPHRHVAKQYEALLDAPVGSAEAERFARGLTLEDGTVCLPARLEPLEGCLARVTLREGKYHQVKRMFEAVERHVRALRRVAMGALTLDASLAPGGTRELTPEEVSRVAQPQAEL